MQVKVIVKFGKQENIEEEDGKLVLKLTTRPEKGKANKRIITLIAEKFSVAKNDVTIIQGKKSKNKIIKIRE